MKHLNLTIIFATILTTTIYPTFESNNHFFDISTHNATNKIITFTNNHTVTYNNTINQDRLQFTLLNGSMSYRLDTRSPIPTTSNLKARTSSSNTIDISYQNLNADIAIHLFTNDSASNQTVTDNYTFNISGEFDVNTFFPITYTTYTCGTQVIPSAQVTFESNLYKNSTITNYKMAVYSTPNSTSKINFCPR